MISNETKMREALECLRADEQLAEKVLARAACSGRGFRRGPLSLAAAVAIGVAVLLATGGVAYAVATSDFFQQAFGDHGMGERSEWGLTTDSGSAYEFSREFSDAPSEKVVADLESAVEEVGLSVSGNGYTLTVEDMVLDENGCGAVTLTLENPNGLGISDDERGMSGKTGELWLTGSDGLDMIDMSFADGETSFPNQRIFYERESLTETSVRATMYFDAFGGLESVLSGVRWSLNWHTGELGTTENLVAMTGWFTPTKIVESRTFSGEGASGSLSPLSLMYSVPKQEGREFVADYVSLRMADGSDLVVCDGDSGVVNTYTDTARGVWSSHTLTHLVDVTQVESIVVCGHLCGDLEQEALEFVLTSTT